MDKDILEGFQQESKQILSELEEIVESLEAEDEHSARNLSQFAQKIDRIMGAAQTLGVEYPDNTGLISIGKIAALCKGMGYKAAETHSKPFLPLFAAFWAETLEVVAELTNALDNAAACEKITKGASPMVQKRLEWLSEKVKSAQPKTQAPTQTNDAKTQAVEATETDAGDLLSLLDKINI